MKTAIALKSLLLAAAALAGAAQAHGLWIEQTGDTKTLFFGEPDNALKEKFPGRLESIKAPQATLIGADGGKTAAKVARGANGFDLGASPATQTLLATEATMEVMDWSKSGLGIVKPMFYARFAPAPLVLARPEMTLDIVPIAPIGGHANAFLVAYKGQPVAKAKVTVIAPNTWTQEHRSDDQGRFVINTPWRGQYVLEITHTDETPGEFDAKRYPSSRHRATLTFVQPTGEEVKQVTPPGHVMR
jgi:uncharacterized GH25 family protein